MITVDFEQVLSAAQQLPKKSQLKLVSALLKAGTPEPMLEPLSGLTEAELQAMVESVLAPPNAKRLQQLLRLNREKKLTKELKAELDSLLEESDRVALMKAKAKYTLSLYAR